MNIEEILKKHIGENGQLNVEAASKELREEQGKVFVPKTDFNSKNEELKQAKTELTSRDQQLEELKKVDAEKLKSEIELLQSKNKDLTEQHEAEIKQLKIDQAIESQLSAAKAKNTKAVRALIDLENIELNTDGTVKGLKEKITALLESDAYLFEGKEPEAINPKVKGAVPGGQKQPGPTGENEVDVTKMTYAEFEAYLESQK